MPRVGFHVRLKSDDERLLRFLKLSPSDVFGRPYAAYLFFLIGGADTAALEWLRKHLVPLDSLTGDFVAFALFADKVPVRLDVPFERVRRRHEAFLGDVPFTEVERIDAYVKAGKLGRVADGDHLNAVTYATDRVAREFGVLDRLPCLVVLDAFPAENIDVIELRDREMESLLPLLRVAIHRLYEEPRFSEMSLALEELGRIRLDLNRINYEIQSKKHDMSRIPTWSTIDSTLAHARTEIRDQLIAGKGFDQSIRQLRDFLLRAGLQIESAIAEGLSRKIVRSAKTIAVLRDLEAKSWPLSEHDRSLYVKTVTQYAHRLLSTCSGGPALETREELLSTLDALIALQSVLIKEVFATLPDEQHVKQACSMRQQVVQAEIIALATELEEVRGRGRRAVEQCIGKDAPSLRRILREVSRERKIRIAGRSVTDSLITYAGKMANPETILKVLGFVTGGD